MSRFCFSALVGLLSAVMLTIIRGGTHDALFVFPVFAIASFTVTYCVVAVIHSPGLARIESALGRCHGVRTMRDLAALLVVASALAWSGRIIQDAGYSGWLVALFVGLAFPLIVCLLASRLPILFGLLAASSVTVSTIIHHPSFRHRNGWMWPREHNIGVWIVLWMILAGLALLVSVPLTISRLRQSEGRTPLNK